MRPGLWSRSRVTGNDQAARGADNWGDLKMLALFAWLGGTWWFLAFFALGGPLWVILAILAIFLIVAVFLNPQRRLGPGPGVTGVWPHVKRRESVTGEPL